MLSIHFATDQGQVLILSCLHFYSSLCTGLLASILTHLKSFLSTAGSQSALKPRYDHIISLLPLSLAPHFPQEKASLHGTEAFPPFLPHSINTRPSCLPLHSTTPCFRAVSSPGWLRFFLQDSVQMSPALKASS